MPTKKGRTCFVPLCNGGYKSSKKKVSLFRAPSDPLRLQEWARNIKRDDKTLDDSCVVCSRHFDERYIQRTFQHLINGKLVEIDRERPALTDDAVPTIFPDAPSYMTKPVPRKRKKRNLADNCTPAPKRWASCSQTNSDSADFGGRETSSDMPPHKPHPLKDIVPPSPSCSKIVLSNNPEVLCFGWHTSAEPGDVCVTKHVTFSTCAAAADYVCTVYCRNIKVDELHVQCEEDALAALRKTDNLLLCPGCEVEPISPGQCTQYGKSFFSKSCLVITPDGKPCLRCKYTRRLILNHMNRGKKRAAAFKQKNARKRKSVHLFRAKKKLSQANKSVQELRELTQSIPTIVLEAKISGLPPKQRLAVKACFEAASRKSTRGMRYDQLWILECILMRMRSPQLYEHLRQHEIMALPSKSCLAKYLQGFKSTFGFNSSVFSALKEKTRKMEEFSLHGGLVFDEIKLSENISVTSSGELSGFVDLGPFDDNNSKTTLSDHGLVIMFQPFQGKWTQILGVFAAKGNVKASTLSKILLEATILAEKSGLFVDFWTSDGAPWNRCLWKLFGVKGMLAVLLKLARSSSFSVCQ
ncbi:uncharacterized protein LOC144100442 [Amblyomma americanum]